MQRARRSGPAGVLVALAVTLLPTVAAASVPPVAVVGEAVPRDLPVVPHDPAVGHPGTIDTTDRADVERVYEQLLLPALDVPIGWTGSAATCVVGRESAASIAATETAVNVYRALAGLPPVRMDEELNAAALDAAVMMDAGGGLSHEPGPGWPCRTDAGARTAGRANLAFGVTGAAAVAAYVEDHGELGHRRWILHPPTRVMGTGSTDRANALHVVPDASAQPGAGPTALAATVAWPPAGHVPAPLVPARWSLSIAGADFSRAQVRMAVDRRALAATVVARNGRYGDPALVWDPALELDELRGGAGGSTVLDVLVTGIGGVEGPGSRAYRVEVFDPARD